MIWGNGKNREFNQGQLVDETVEKISSSLIVQLPTVHLQHLISVLLDGSKAALEQKIGYEVVLIPC